MGTVETTLETVGEETLVADEEAAIVLEEHAASTSSNTQQQIIPGQAKQCLLEIINTILPFPIQHKGQS
ncbi:MAG TPA: hypothetical protein VEL69_08020, partial [Ktedonobacteraceae bacterium]|nr:hypothetical protein [Ktedonobacteraceae bacterium]